MKFDPIVEYKNNELFNLDNKKINLENIKEVLLKELKNTFTPSFIKENEFNLIKIIVDQKDILLEDGSYNEELLAEFRDVLKSVEDKNIYIVVSSFCDECDSVDSERAEVLISTLKHTARRIKDCICVIGFEVPSAFVAKDEEINQNSYSYWFISELYPKHKHYLFFINKINATDELMCKSIVNNGYVLY